jgi:hypothetical protein
MKTIPVLLPALAALFLALAATAFAQAPAAPAARPAPRIFMIGHAHIDPVWRWTKDEGQAEVLATFRSALIVAGPAGRGASGRRPRRVRYRPG